ncbi:hypothetical protein [Parasphingorhabdus pacifica]
MPDFRIDSAVREGDARTALSAGWQTPRDSESGRPDRQPPGVTCREGPVSRARLFEGSVPAVPSVSLSAPDGPLGESALPESPGHRPGPERFNLARAVEPDHGTSSGHWLARRFVFPLNFSVAREALSGRARTVLLAGESGSGRRAAALMLLRSLDGQGGTEARGTGIDGTGTGGTAIPLTEVSSLHALRDPRTVTPGTRMLLDLTRASGPPPPEALDRIVSAQELLRERGANLVVLLPSGYRPGGHRPRRLVVELERPRGSTVLRKHLAADGLLGSPAHAPEPREQGPAVPDPGAPDLAELLSTAPMCEIAGLARLHSSILPPGPAVVTGHCWSLLAHSAVRRQLAASWRRALARDSGRSPARVRAWLEAAVANPLAANLLTVLVEAADGRIDRLGRLHVVARDWAGTDRARVRIRNALAEKLDAAQEIRPADFHLGTEAEVSSR